MDTRSLEKQLLEHLEKESLILTPVNVGFVLCIDADDAINVLDALVEAGKMELTSGSGTTATYKRVGHATCETTPGVSSVMAPKSSAALYHLLLNVFIPGLGSLIYGRIGFWFVLTVLFGAGIAMIFVLPSLSRLFSIAVFLVWYLVAILGSISYYMKDPWSKKE
ncbi:MAG: hypothetical protein JXR76_02840 [Deltaproteobacteria bacterium]|nr:hypothetical protein [Deltaproteobacteria bacterium]